MDMVASSPTQNFYHALFTLIGPSQVGGRAKREGERDYMEVWGLALVRTMKVTIHTRTTWLIKGPTVQTRVVIPYSTPFICI